MTILGVRSSSTDTDEEVRKYATEKSLSIPVLADDGNVLADFFNVPNFMVFVVIDAEGRMRSWGGIDDHHDEKRAKRPHLRNALDAVLAGKDVAAKRTFAFG
ncbi:MAG: hypothetical protein AAB074_11640 [Planctomycetota bacterium]